MPADRMQRRYELLVEELEERGVDLPSVVQRLEAQRIETPSWGYGAMGTRFHVFRKPGAPRTIQERLADAAQVHRYTGAAPSVALHIPWDKVDDWAGLKQTAADLGVEIGAINPNLFQEEEYMLGSFCHPDPAVRRQALDHVIECVDIMEKTGSGILSLWFADGTDYPGQDNFRSRKHRMEECLAETYKRLGPGMRMLIEYKFFEPAFYHTDIPDWGLATLFAKKLGPQAQTLVDLGHHAQGTNIEHIIAILIDEGKLGGFHFNNRKYADDDLTTSSINPYELFLIYNELAAAEADPAVDLDVAYMIDQSHNTKNGIEALIQSVVNIQTAYAKALIIPRDTLRAAQAAGDVVGAESLLAQAFQTDVAPLLVKVRQKMGRPAEPLAAFRQSGYLAKVARERDG